MTAPEGQWLAALALMVAALFVSAGLPIASQWRRRFRVAAISVFFVAMVVAIVQTAIWLTGSSR